MCSLGVDVHVCMVKFVCSGTKYIHVHTCACGKFACVYACVHVHVYTCMYIHIVRTYTCMYILYVYTYSMYIYVHTCMYVHVR